MLATQRNIDGDLDRELAANILSDRPCLHYGFLGSAHSGDSTRLLGIPNQLPTPRRFELHASCTGHTFRYSLGFPPLPQNTVQGWFPDTAYARCRQTAGCQDM